MFQPSSLGALIVSFNLKFSGTIGVKFPSRSLRGTHSFLLTRYLLDALLETKPQIRRSCQSRSRSDHRSYSIVERKEGGSMTRRKTQHTAIRVTISMPKFRVAVFITTCNQPSFTEVDLDIGSIESLVGGKSECADLDEYGVSRGLKLYCCGDTDDSPDRVINRHLPDDSISGTFIIVRRKNKRFVDLTPEDERLLSKWNIRSTWGSFQ